MDYRKRWLEDSHSLRRKLREHTKNETLVELNLQGLQTDAKIDALIALFVEKYGDEAGHRFWELACIALDQTVQKSLGKQKSS